MWRSHPMLPFDRPRRGFKCRGSDNIITSQATLLHMPDRLSFGCPIPMDPSQADRMKKKKIQYKRCYLDYFSLIRHLSLFD